MRLLLFCLLLMGCSRPGHEREGDQAWHAGRWDEAMTAYSQAGTAPRVVAKYADAALRAGRLNESVDGWNKLAGTDPERSEEAATGLARVALAAGSSHDDQALARALLGLRRLDPGWPISRLGVTVPTGLADSTAANEELWLLAAASAPDRGSAGAALLGLSRTAAAQGDCPAAIGAAQGAVLRLEGPDRRAALEQLGRCELTMGELALQEARSQEAADWFRRAGTHDSSGQVNRRAWLGLGDARLMQSDTSAAILAWERVVTISATADSLFDIALTRLHELNRTGMDTLMVAEWP